MKFATANEPNSSESEAKPLFHQILAATPYGSRFYWDSSHPEPQVMKNEYFEECDEKKCGGT